MLRAYVRFQEVTFQELKLVRFCAKMFFLIKKTFTPNVFLISHLFLSVIVLLLSVHAIGGADRENLLLRKRKKKLLLETIKILKLSATSRAQPVIT
jgi:hypothetical protein